MSLNDVRDLQIRIGLNAARRENGLSAVAERIGETGIDDHEIALSLTIDAQRLFVDLSGEPVVENPGATAKRDRAILLWRIDETKARRDIEFTGDVIL